MKPKYLYHGSSKLVKNSLIPKQAKDVDRKNIHNNLNAIYATSVKTQAIAMALHSDKNVKHGSLQMHKVKGRLTIKESIIYKGWPKQKYVYLYTLPSTTFVNRPKGSPQWVSFKSVKLTKIEKLLVKKYIHLVRRATRKEKQNWQKELKHNI